MIEIRYTRPPGRTTVFHQRVVHRSDTCIVTLLEHARTTKPVVARNTVVLEPDAPIVWFTFPGEWHDIGRFHTRDGTFTGYYANVITPINAVSTNVWETTDLLLDVWLDGDGAVLLDEDELDDAVGAGAVEVRLADRARVEAAALMRAARGGDWPPAICRHWTLERAREITTAGGGTPDAAPV